MISFILSMLPWTGIAVLAVALVQGWIISHLRHELSVERDRKKLVQERLSEAVLKLNAANLQIAQARQENEQIQSRLLDAQLRGDQIMADAQRAANAILAEG